tara:strand:- start:258 stop:1031 length:774 start_codon:yes stop_codon:yes gene_type:complete
MGRDAMYNGFSTGSGDGNIAIGRNALLNVGGGSQNIYIGNNLPVSSSQNHQLKIGSGSIVPFSASLITGDVLFPSKIQGSQLLIQSGSNGPLNVEDAFTVAISSSNSVYSPIAGMGPNPASFQTEHSSSQDTFAGSGSAIQLISSARFINPSLSAKNCVVQLTSIAAQNNTHAADFAVGTRTVSPGNVTEKLRITHDGKTLITGSFHVNNSGSFMTGSTVILENLPTIEPTVSGSLWLSGSGAGSASGSKYLMVFNG